LNFRYARNIRLNEEEKTSMNKIMTDMDAIKKGPVQGIFIQEKWHFSFRSRRATSRIRIQ